MQKPNVLKIDHLITVEPMTTSQEVVFTAWDEGNHLVMTGAAGSGKTFSALYLALEDTLDTSEPQHQIILCRSAVPTREIGYLPGTLDEKLDAYTAPYRQICSHLFDDDGAYDKLTKQGLIKFVSTSHLRGTTFDDAIIIIDEMQNLTFHELDSIITRVGNNCRVVFCGDYYQTDFVKTTDRAGMHSFMEIIEHMNRFTIVEFTWADIVRSDFVRDYIMTKEMLMKEKVQ
jgi:phosphate starvation-inducible PhoH-like protein